MNKKELHKVIKKLVGPVKPIGDTSKDLKRLKNLSGLAELVSLLTDDIIDVSKETEDQMASVYGAKTYADSFLQVLHKKITKQIGTEYELDKKTTTKECHEVD